MFDYYQRQIATVLKDLANSLWAGCLIGLMGTATIVAAYSYGVRVDFSTVVLSFVTMVLLLASIWGITVGLVMSLVASACLNYFFIDPVYTFRITKPHDFIALCSFLLTSFVASYLSHRARQNTVALEQMVAERTAALQRVVSELETANKHLNSRSRESMIIGEMIGMLQCCATLEEAGQVVVRTFNRSFPKTSGALYLFSASRNVVEALVEWGESPPGESVFSPSDCWALRRGSPYSFADIQSGIPCGHVDRQMSNSYICVPLSAQGDTLGMLHVTSAERPAATFDKEIETASDSLQQLTITMAEQASLALASLRMRDALKQQSIRDPLTGLFNRRYMEEFLDKEISRCSRKGRALSVFMLDFDHFKHFNDTFGHEAGDLMLREFSYHVQKRLRGEDIVCRYGGEEFVIILTEADLEAAKEKATQLITDARHLNVLQRGRSLGSITLSIGIATFPGHGASVDALLRSADLALYQAKEQGRDRFVVTEFSPLMK